MGSGFCGEEENGENLQWTLNQEGTLRIWGNGAMGACVISSTNQGPNAPWYSLRTSIKEIVIEEGVTTIANNAFYGCTELVSVSMPDTIEHIYGSDAVRASGSLTYYDAGPFYNCEKLENIILSSRLKTLGPQAFLNCTSLKNNILFIF